MNILCDTNAVTGLRLGNPIVLGALEHAETVFLSVIVLGELLYGYQNGRKRDENMRFLDAFTSKSRVEVLGVGHETASVYAELRTELKRAGRPIPTNDLWIAAQSIENGAALISNDAHFEHLIGLRRISF